MPAPTITTLSGLDANKCLSGDETYALVFRAEVNGIPLEGVDYVRTDKNGPVTGLDVTMCPLKRDNRIKRRTAAALSLQAVGQAQCLVPATDR